FELYIGKWTHLLPENRTLADYVNIGRAPRVFAESSDPARMVPIVGRAEDFMLAVSGDPLRTNAYAFVHNGILGYPVCKAIRLPAKWKELLQEAKGI
ncbi:MAG: hypothetical protein JO189_05320, partial [Deltaproteobacteria bacterium]|nr:hypothetical protein [Deltaproteobacteria bacterium]